MNTESFLSLRTVKKFSVFLSLVKVLYFLFLEFVFYFSLYFDLQLQAVVYLRVIENLHIIVMAMVGFSTRGVARVMCARGHDTESAPLPSHPFPPSGVAAGEGVDPNPSPPLMFRPS